MSADGGDHALVPSGGPDDAEALALPQPPYTVDDDPSQGLACFYPGCPFKGEGAHLHVVVVEILDFVWAGYSWPKIVSHLGYRHQRKLASFVGTVFHTCAKKELNERQRANYAKRKDTSAAGVATFSFSAFA